MRGATGAAVGVGDGVVVVMTGAARMVAGGGAVAVGGAYVRVGEVPEPAWLPVAVRLL